jgi:aminoglycoside 2''-phosphotransferase
LSDRAISDGPSLEALTARIRAAFPTLYFSRAELIGSGDDNLVVILDGEQVARFPRSAEYRDRFAAELILLAKLEPVSPLDVPHYSHVARDRSCGVYRMIQGHEMTPEVFFAMKPEDRDADLAALAAFLSALHAFPAETIANAAGAIARTWTGEQFAAHYRGVTRAGIAQIVSAQALVRFDAFHDAFETVAPGPARLAHNDLTDDHILVRDSRIAGIIDFSDAAFGDPAIDFAWFWRLGEVNVDRLLRDYRFAADDASLKERSRWTFVRYMINEFWYSFDGTRHRPTEQWLAELEPHLERLGF